MAFIDIADVDADKLEDGYFVGSITISPSKGLIDMISDEFDLDDDFSFAGLAISNLALKIDVQENSEDKFKVTVSVMNGKSAYASITLAAELSSGKKVSTPSKTDDMEDWAEDIDFDALINKIEKSGLPDYIVDLFEDITDR